MNLLNYNSIPSLFYHLLLLLSTTHIINAYSVIIEDFESFENELKNSKTYNEVELIIAKNITIDHKIEIKSNKNVNISIIGASSNIYIDWNVYNKEIIDSDDYDTLKIYDANKVILENISIIGNVYFMNINNVIVNSYFSNGYMNIYYCDLSINDSIFKVSNDRALNVLVLNDSSGSIKNTIINASPKIKIAVDINRSKFTFNHVIIKGSFDKLEKLPIYHRALNLYSSNVQLNDIEIDNFGDISPNGLVFYLRTKLLKNNFFFLFFFYFFYLFFFLEIKINK